MIEGSPGSVNTTLFCLLDMQEDFACSSFVTQVIIMPEHRPCILTKASSILNLFLYEFIDLTCMCHHDQIVELAACI